MNRVRVPELMDEPGADPRELDRSLRDLHAVNRWLGGYDAAVKLVLRLAAGVRRRPVRILDLGTGSADVPIVLVRRARQRGIDLRITATDLHPETVSVAREATRGRAEIEVERADALNLHFPDRSFDLSLCCTTLHHFDDDDAVRLLREMDRVAIHGIVVSDLSRSRAAYAGALLLGATLWRRHPMTRHDGPASVRAAFTVPEIRELAVRAGLRGQIRARSHPVFRLSLVADRTSAVGINVDPALSLSPG